MGGSTTFGGPDSQNTVPQLSNGEYIYFQYQLAETGNCHLIFAKLRGGKYEIVADIDASQINKRLRAIVTPTDNDFIPFLECSPLGWGDVNQNGKPDLPIVFIWANQYTGSELHIFEVADGAKVENLTQNLPGIISPWEFDPNYANQIVIDLAWASHDCIYPPMWVYWVYDWRDDRYVDITAELDFSRYISSRVSSLESAFGYSFTPYFQIQELTQILLIYDKLGARKKGWEEYKRLADETNWPGTSTEDLRWLRSDVAHFEKQYLAGAPFTPNDYCVP